MRGLLLRDTDVSCDGPAMDSVLIAGRTMIITHDSRTDKERTALEQFGISGRNSHPTL